MRCPHFHVRSVERTGTQEHTDHVERAILTGVVAEFCRIIVALIAHFHRALSVGVRIPHLVFAVSIALERLFWHNTSAKVKSGVSHKRVAHHEYFVGAF